MLLSPKKEELYWSLIIESGWVQAAIWKINEEKSAEILAIGPATHWEGDLIDSADTSLSGAVQNLPEDASEPTKTVFGVSPSWVSEGQIKKEHLDKIRELCSKLSLEPSGFVVLPEAIAHHVKTEEGAPVSSVIIGVSQESLDVTVFKLGNLMGTVEVARSVSVVDDIVEGLARFKGTEPVPSRFLLYDGKEGELEEVKQALIAGDWQGALKEKVNLLHTPQIEIIDPQKKVIAVSLAGASEVGQATSIMLSLPKEEEISPDAEDKSEESLGAEDVGFAVEKDVAGQKSEEIETEQKDKTHFTEEQQGVPKGFPGGNKITGILRNIRISLLSVFSKARNLSGSMGFMGKGILAPGAIFLVIVFIAGFAGWWFLPKANVTIYVSPKKIEQSETIAISSKEKSSNLEEMVLQGRLIEVNVSGDKTRETTGTKTVGDEAKGEVTFYRPGSEITLPSGTVLTGPGGLKFVLDDSVTVASGSAISPGKSNGKVTAADIGAEYNLASGTTFGVGNYPSGDLEAKNNSSFSGGSSREITAVSEEDRKTLENSLTEELTESAIVKLKEELDEDESLVEEAISATASARTFNHKVGDEADNLKLSLKLDVSGLIVSRDDLNALARKTLEDQIPSGFALRDNQIQMEFQVEKESAGVWEVEVSFGANLLPEIKTDEIAKAIVGKYPPLAQDYLSSIPGFTRAEISLSPKFPGRLGTLPRVVKNITIEVSAER